MASTLKRISGPAFISNSAANLYTPPAATIITVIRQLHFANKTSSAVTFSVYVGATGGSSAGTELFGTRTIAAFDTYDWFASPGLVMKDSDFLSAIAGTASAVAVTVMGEQFVTP